MQPPTLAEQRSDLIISVEYLWKLTSLGVLFRHEKLPPSSDVLLLNWLSVIDGASTLWSSHTLVSRLLRLNAAELQRCSS